MTDTFKKLHNWVLMIAQCLVHFLVVIACRSQILLCSEVANLAYKEDSRRHNEHCFPPAGCAQVLVESWITSLVLERDDVDECKTNQHHDVVKSKFGEGKPRRVINASVVDLFEKL